MVAVPLLFKIVFYVSPSGDQSTETAKSQMFSCEALSEKFALCSKCDKMKRLIEKDTMLCRFQKR